jgi:UDPglucose 6-dehydrogenase
VSRIFIVGSGAAGSATGVDLVRAGHHVTFVDACATRVAALAAQGLDAGCELDLDGEPEAFIFLCLPTPNNGHGYDLSAVEDGAAQVGRALAGADARHIVVVRSTVPPGTTRELVGPLLERHSGKTEGVGFGLAASPDFHRATHSGVASSGARAGTGTGTGTDDTSRPRMTVIGARSQRVAHRLGDLLGPLGSQVRVFEDPATAELIKCTSSLFNATKISFWNEIWGVCDQLGVDPDQVADAVATSAQGSTDPAYGLRGGAPYGGGQLPGDTVGFLGFAAELGIPMPLLSAVVGVNGNVQQRMAAELDGVCVLSAIPRSRSELRSDPDADADPDLPGIDIDLECDDADDAGDLVRPPGLRIPRQLRR